MEARDAEVYQFPALLDAPFDAKGFGVVVVLALESLVHKLLREVGVEGLRQGGELRQLGERLDARYDRYVDASLSCRLDVADELLVVEEHLRDHILRSGIHFSFQPVQILLEVRRLLVLLGVASHSVVERLDRRFYRRAVHELAAVEVVDLLLQLQGVAVSILHGLEYVLVLGFVATQHQ